MIFGEVEMFDSMRSEKEFGGKCQVPIVEIKVNDKEDVDIVRKKLGVTQEVCDYYRELKGGLQKDLINKIKDFEELFMVVCWEYPHGPFETLKEAEDFVDDIDNKNKYDNPGLIYLVKIFRIKYDF